MHADLWITPEDSERVYVTGTPDPEGRVRLHIGPARLSLPDTTARNLVHALLAHYAGKVDFHLIEPAKVEAVDQGLRASLRELDREANNEDGDLAYLDDKAADAFSERPTP